MAKTQEMHTPTPWALDRFGEDMQTQIDQLSDGIGTDREWMQVQDVHEHGGEVVALAHPSNAAFIIRAVNSHAALVDALEGLFEHCAMMHKHWGENDNTREANAAIQAGYAALTLAKGA